MFDCAGQRDLFACLHERCYSRVVSTQKPNHYDRVSLLAGCCVFFTEPSETAAQPHVSAMIKSSMDHLYVDGQTARVSLYLSATANEVLDLKRKLEKATTDVLWKERESAGHLAELRKSQKEHKSACAELQSCQELNEQLQQSLRNASATIASQRADLKEVEESIQLTEKLKKSESASSTAVRKVKSLEAEVKSLKEKSTPPPLEEIKRLTALLKCSKISEDALKTDVTTLQLKTETADLKNKQFEYEIEDLMNRINNSRNLSHVHEEQLDEKHVLLIEKNKIITSSKEEIERLQSDVLVSNELYTVLQMKLDDMRIKFATLERDNKRSFTKLEQEHDQLQQCSHDLACTVVGYEKTQVNADGERIQLKARLEAAATELATYAATAQEYKERGVSDKSEIKSLKNDILRLRNESQDLKLQIDRIKGTPLLKEKEFLYLQQTAASAVRERHLALESVSTERKLRRSSEESARTLHLRMCFLLEQLEQASDFRAAWVEQKSVLKAEVQGLHKANKLLRKERVSYQSCSASSALSTMDFSDARNFNSDGSATLQFSASKCLESSTSHDCFENGVEESSDTADGDVSDGTLLKAERAIEKAMFDVICAFSSASASSLSRKKRTQHSDSALYEVRQCDSGICEIVMSDKDKKGSSVDADELLNALQLPLFMKLCHSHSKKDASTLPLFAEKLASVLNFHRTQVQQIHQQLCSGRMESTALISRAANLKSRSNTARLLFTKERAMKQTAILKIVRDQIALSDMLIVISDVSKRASEQLERTNTIQNQGPGSEVTSLLQDLVRTSEELSVTTVGSGSSTGLAGAIELCLPECGVDDETLFAVLDILKESPSTDAPSTQAAHPAPVLGPGLGSGSDPRALAPPPRTASALSKGVTGGGDYLDRILLLNLKGNSLTDLSCKTLSVLIERSANLRMLDLRGNCISPEGVKVLVSAVSRNASVVQTNQRKARPDISVVPKETDRVGDILMIMIEGIRGNTKRSPEESDPGSPPLRIDLRHNDPLKGRKISEDLLECTLFSNRHLVAGDIDVGYDRAQIFRGAVSRSEYECRPSTAGARRIKKSTNRARSADTLKRGSGIKIALHEPRPETRIEESDLDEDNEHCVQEEFSHDDVYSDSDVRQNQSRRGRSSEGGQGQGQNRFTRKRSVSIDRAAAITLSGALSNSHIASSTGTGTLVGTGSGVVGGVGRRPSTAGPSLGSQATSDNTHTHSNCNINSNNSSNNYYYNLSGTAHQSKVITDRALSPLRDKNHRSKDLLPEQHGYGNRETGVKKDDSVLDLTRSVQDKDRRALVPIERNQRKEWQDVSSAGTSGLFQKRKVILAASITKMARTNIMPKPKSAVAGGRKFGQGPATDHTRFVQLFNFKNATEGRKSASVREYQDDKAFHFQDNSGYQKPSFNSNACKSSTKEMDTILNEVHQQAIEPGFLF